MPYLVYPSCVIYNDCDPLRPQCTWHTDCLYSSVLIPVVLQRLYASYDLHPLSTHLQHWSWTKLRPPAAPSDTVSRAFNRSPTCDRVGSVRGILVLILRVLVLASVQWCVLICRKTIASGVMLTGGTSGTFIIPKTPSLRPRPSLDESAGQDCRFTLPEWCTEQEMHG